MLKNAACIMYDTKENKTEDINWKLENFFSKFVLFVTTSIKTIIPVA